MNELVNYHLVNSKCLNIYQRSTFSYLKLICKQLKIIQSLQEESKKRVYSVITKEEL